MRHRLACLTRFARDERGAATFTMLFVILILTLVGGVALDIANRHRAAAALQVAADMSAASGAIVLGERLTLGSPQDEARRSFRDTLGRTNMKDAWVDGSFGLGRYDEAEGVFTRTDDIEDADAVRVQLVRSPEYGNGEPTLLLRMIGLEAWDIRVESIARVATVDALPCPDALLSLQARARLWGRDMFAGVCADARVGVSTAPPAWFSDSAAELLSGVLAAVALPDKITLLSSLRKETAMIDVLREARPVRGDTLDVNDLRAGASLRVSCPDSGVLSLHGPLSLEGVALLSECPVRFDSSVSASASLILTNLKALHPGRHHDGLASDAALMEDGRCAPGDGVRLYLFADASITAELPLLGTLAGLTEETELASLSGLSRLVPQVDVSALANLTDRLGICLGARALAPADRVSLRSP